jgi:integrase
VPRKLYDTLRAEEVPLLLASLKPHWRPVFATAVWTGLRKGELLGLRKSDVDMVAGTIAVRHSYDADTTKGGHADLIPIAAGLRPYLAEAMLSARGEYVFPDAEGRMRSRQTKEAARAVAMRT